MPVRASCLMDTAARSEHQRDGHPADRWGEGSGRSHFSFPRWAAISRRHEHLTGAPSPCVSSSARPGAPATPRRSAAIRRAAPTKKAQCDRPDPSPPTAAFRSCSRTRSSTPAARQQSLDLHDQPRLAQLLLGSRQLALEVGDPLLGPTVGVGLPAAPPCGEPPASPRCATSTTPRGAGWRPARQAGPRRPRPGCAACTPRRTGGASASPPPAGRSVRPSRDRAQCSSGFG
jgi:hypothetical protein